LFLTTHATLGLVIARFIPNPWLAFGLGFICHYLADIIPHDKFIKDPQNEKKVRSDEIDMQSLPEFKTFAIFAVTDLLIFLTGLVLILYFKLPQNPTTAFWAMTGSVLPDFLWLPYAVLKIKFFKIFHIINQKAHDIFPDITPTWLGTTLQAIFVSVVLYLLYFH